VIVDDGRTVEGDADTEPAAGTSGDDLPWYEGLLESVTTADGDP
jgi:hypothetical protein